MANLLATVILYNPDGDVVTNIKSYLPFIEELVIVDNSDKPHNILYLLNEEGIKFHYIKNDENVGIAKALNQAAEFGIKNGFTWLLTMDQDSKFKENSFQKLFNAIDANDEYVGIYTPLHVNKDTVIRTNVGELSSVRKTMTSGNLLNLKVYKSTGPFEEKLFIDYVDHEFNFRLLVNGYKILRVNSAHLIHNQGNIKSYKSSVASIKTTNHNVVRRYYITRNRLYVIFKYVTIAPKFFFKELYQYWMDLFRILLLEKEKGRKVMAVIRGTKDWLFGNFGKYKY